MAMEYRGGGGGKVELNSTTIAPPKRQADWPPVTSIKESVSTFKRGHRVVESLIRRLLVAEGGFEAILSLVSSTKKCLVYLKGEINGTNVSMLIDTWASNSFITPMCAKRMKVEVADTALPVKINFAQGSCQAAQVVKEMRFKAGGAKFKEDFKICGLEDVDIVLGNTILHYYGVKVRQRPSVHVVLLGSNEKPKTLPFGRDLYASDGRRAESGK